MKVLFVRNEFKLKDYLTYLSAGLRIYENRWFNHLARYDEDLGIVTEYVGSGFKKTTWFEWNKAQPKRKFIIRNYPSNTTSKEAMKIMDFVGKITNYEYGIFWKFPINDLIRKITFKKIVQLIPASISSIFCADYIVMFILGLDYNPKILYGLRYFEDKKENEKVHLSNDYLTI